MNAKLMQIRFLCFLCFLFVLSGCTTSRTSSTVTNQQADAQPATQLAALPGSQEEAAPKPSTVLVDMTDVGFSPEKVTIKAGDAVKFVNRNTVKRWPASDVHPTHVAYPGSNIAKCKSAPQGSIFDACDGLDEGEMFQFTFNEKGTWQYHDHLDPGDKGTIIVE